MIHWINANRTLYIYWDILRIHQCGIYNNFILNETWRKNLPQEKKRHINFWNNSTLYLKKTYFVYAIRPKSPGILFFFSSSFSYEHTDARTYHRDSLSILHQQFFVDAAHLRTKKRKRKKINKFGILTKQSLKFTTGDARFIFIIMQIGQQTMAIRWKNDASLFISKYIFKFNENDIKGKKREYFCCPKKKNYILVVVAVCWKISKTAQWPKFDRHFLVLFLSIQNLIHVVSVHF